MRQTKLDSFSYLWRLHFLCIPRKISPKHTIFLTGTFLAQQICFSSCMTAAQIHTCRPGMARHPLPSRHPGAPRADALRHQPCCRADQEAGQPEELTSLQYRAATPVPEQDRGCGQECEEGKKSGQVLMFQFPQYSWQNAQL